MALKHGKKGTGRCVLGINRKGVTAQAGTTKCVRGRASGATVLLGHMLRVFTCSTREKRHFDTYQNRLDTSGIRISARYCVVVWKRFPRGTPLRGTALTIIPVFVADSLWERTTQPTLAALRSPTFPKRESRSWSLSRQPSLVLHPSLTTLASLLPSFPLAPPVR